MYISVCSFTWNHTKQERDFSNKMCLISITHVSVFVNWCFDVSSRFFCLLPS